MAYKKFTFSYYNSFQGVKSKGKVEKVLISKFSCFFHPFWLPIFFSKSFLNSCLKLQKKPAPAVCHEKWLFRFEKLKPDIFFNAFTTFSSILLVNSQKLRSLTLHKYESLIRQTSRCPLPTILKWFILPVTFMKTVYLYFYCRFAIGKNLNLVFR